MNKETKDAASVAASAAPQNAIIETAIIATGTPTEVPTVEAQINEAIVTHLLSNKPNKSAFSKAYFTIHNTTKETFATHKKAIIAIFEANGQGVAGSFYNSIGNDFKHWLTGVPYPSKQAGNGTTIKARNEKPAFTKEQQTTLNTLATSLGVDSVAYQATLTAFDAELEQRVNDWVKETAEQDKRNKSTFVKNFVRQCNDTAFLNSLYELCKEQAEQTAPTEDGDNQPS